VYILLLSPPTCSLSIRFSRRCKTWLSEAHPDLYARYYSECELVAFPLSLFCSLMLVSISLQLLSMKRCRLLPSSNRPRSRKTPPRWKQRQKHARNERSKSARSEPNVLNWSLQSTEYHGTVVKGHDQENRAQQTQVHHCGARSRRFRSVSAIINGTIYVNSQKYI
jgi:hypothetical protein